MTVIGEGIDGGSSRNLRRQPLRGAGIRNGVPHSALGVPLAVWHPLLRNGSTAEMDSPRRNLIKGITLGTLLGVVLQLGGYLLTRGDQEEFGLAMFVGVPFISGFAVAAVVRRPRRIVGCILVGGIITFSVLLFTGWEGIICCVMSLPLVAVGVAIGALVGYKMQGRFIDEATTSSKLTAVLLVLCPFLIAAAERVERPYRSVQRWEVFTTETDVAASPERVWELIGRMQKLDGPRPFLLRVGLPVPMRCELKTPAVGGRRVCYFDQGLIAQEVTEWQPPVSMGLRVTESTLPGRHWLTFRGAAYELFAVRGLTRIARHTTIGTRLYPRWYWRPLERWGVTSEHAFVFSNLQAWTQMPSSATE